MSGKIAVIGDSIAWGSGSGTEGRKNGWAYWANKTPGIMVDMPDFNSGSTTHILHKLREYRDMFPVDEYPTLYCNAGLHDAVSYPGSPITQIAQYRASAYAIAAFFAGAGYKFQWITSTPSKIQATNDNVIAQNEKLKESAQATETPTPYDLNWAVGIWLWTQKIHYAENDPVHFDQDSSKFIGEKIGAYMANPNYQGDIDYNFYNS